MPWDIDPDSGKVRGSKAIHEAITGEKASSLPRDVSDGKKEPKPPDVRDFVRVVRDDDARTFTVEVSWGGGKAAWLPVRTLEFLWYGTVPSPITKQEADEIAARIGNMAMAYSRQCCAFVSGR